MADTPVLTFEVFRGETLLFRQDIPAESVTIGKGPAAMLRIEDEGLADLQAVINLNDDGTVQLLDLVGDGLRVNGAGVVNSVLNNGDTIEVGPIRIVVGLPEGTPFADDEATQIARPIDTPAQIRGGAATREDAGDEVTEHGTPEAAAAEAAEAPAEDVMAFIMRSNTSQSDLGLDRAAPPVLEVAEIWGDIVLDVKHFARGSKPDRKSVV